MHDYITVTCESHKQTWEPTLNNLIRGGGHCSICKKELVQELFCDSKEDFIQKAQEIHGHRYGYDDVVYQNSQTKVDIHCPDHGVFRQRPNSHLTGSGCQSCHSSKGEVAVRLFLEDFSLPYIEQYPIPGRFKHSRFKFDFFLPENGVFIEFDGEFHSEIKPHLSLAKGDIRKAKKNFEDQKKRDSIKNEWTEKNGFKLVRVRFDDDVENKLLIELDEFIK